MSLETRESKIYDNILVLHPDGTRMFYASIKQTNYYLNNDLAILVDTDPVTIQFTFEPNGYGTKDVLLVARENKCVVCGSDEGLTNHHVIPYAFRKRCEKLKLGRHHDLLPMCEECHLEYERKYVNNFKRNLVDMLGLDINNFDLIKPTKIQKMKSLANTILNHSNQIPTTKLRKLKQEIRDFFGYKRLTTNRLKDITNKEAEFEGKHRNIEEFIVEGCNDYNKLAFLWREHFIKCMSPKYLPKDFQWIIDNKVKLEEINGRDEFKRDGED